MGFSAFGLLLTPPELLQFIIHISPSPSQDQLNQWLYVVFLSEKSAQLISHVYLTKEKQLAVYVTFSKSKPYQVPCLFYKMCLSLRHEYHDFLKIFFSGNTFTSNVQLNMVVIC